MAYISQAIALYAVRFTKPNSVYVWIKHISQEGIQSWLHYAKVGRIGDFHSSLYH